MRILVCGGRNYADRNRVFAELDARRSGVSCVIHGGAYGADGHARDWATMKGLPCKEYRAAWSIHGRAAGPLRNARMLFDGKPDLVLAFTGGSGTADMIRRAKEAGVPVEEIQ